MEFFGTLFLIFLFFRGLSWLSSLFSSGSSSSVGSSGGGTPARLGRDPGDLSVSLRPDSFRPEDGSEALPVLRVSISGNIEVPRAGEPVKFVVRIVDETNGESNKMPVFCIIPGLGDEDGAFMFEQEVDLPYASCGLDGLDLVGIPTFALAGPRSGSRRLRIAVFVVSRRNDEIFFGFGSTVTRVDLALPGYQEIAERTAHREMQIAQLALSLAAADGRIDKRETASVRRFFAERHADISDEAERHRKIDKLMNDALAPFRNKSGGGVKLKELMDTICTQLAEDGDDSVKQTAYELAVQVVAADDEVDDREHQALRFVAKRLDLPSGFVKEVHDRNLRANMFDDGDAEKLLGIPPGMSPTEKRDFLSKEYRKWRSRVTHSDPKVAAEASVRLQQIAKARAALGDA